jgi:hypothetical protein
MPGRPWSGVSLPGPSGVRGAARVHGLGWNRRGPSALPASGKDRVYKPMVKSPGAQRESEGAVVLGIGVQHNAPGGKGPHFDHAGGEGKREGMAGSARSNYPGGLSPVVAVGGKPSGVKVRQLQRRLWAAAKRTRDSNSRGLAPDTFSKSDVRRTLDATRDGQIADRYSKAIEQLGSSTIDVTIGGIYAMERVARDSPRDHPAALIGPAMLALGCLHPAVPEDDHSPARGSSRRASNQVSGQWRWLVWITRR